MIDRLTEDKIKGVANIVDVIGDFCDLRKKGIDFECLCPFHNDTNLGNFKISPTRNIYKCFACGAQGGAVDFLMAHEGLSYPDALRWLGKKYNIEVDQEQKKFEVRPSQPQAIRQHNNREICTIPAEYVARSLDTHLRSQFQAYLCRIITDVHRIVEVAKLYQLGVTQDEGVIFWQIDEQNRVRSGKIMHYKYDGHRDRQKDGDAPTWTHSSLKRSHILPADWQLTQCLFGAHLLPKYTYKHVAVVESEKTAILGAIALPQFLWVSCGGLQNLEAGQKHKALRGRKVIMFPDTDTEGKAFALWSKKAAEWREIGIDVQVSGWLEQMATEAEKHAKIDVGDIFEKDMRTVYEPSPIELMIADNPYVQELLEKFNLKVV